MIYSFDRGYVLFATVFAALGTVICSKIILTQLTVLAEGDSVNESTSSGGNDEEVGGERDVSTMAAADAAYNPLSFSFLHEYVSLRLPFELFGGYSVCLVFMYLNTWLHVFGLNSKVSTDMMLNRLATMFIPLYVFPCSPYLEIHCNRHS